MTYAPIGLKQVVTAGSEEKRVITVMVSLSNNGTLLPFQAIYKGSTQTSLPSKKAKSYKEATEAGFLFESSMTQTYWSTQDTMRSFVNRILVPYYDKIKKELGLPPQQRSMWQIDCWSVHRSEEFMTWMGKSHENIVVNFVPARMTGLFQPANVGIQCILKQSMRKSAHADIVDEVLKKLANGQATGAIGIDSKLGILHDRTVHWLWNAYHDLNKPSTVKKVCISSYSSKISS